MTTQLADTRFVPSHFVSLAHQPDGSLAVHCSRTGAIGVVEPAQAEAARRALVRGTVSTRDDHPIVDDLIAGGFLIPERLDEQALQRHQSGGRHRSERSRVTSLMNAIAWDAVRLGIRPGIGRDVG